MSQSAVTMPTSRTWIDVSVVLVLCVLGVIGFEPPFGGFGFLLAGVGGLVVGAAVAVVAGMLRLDAIATTIGVVIAYFLLGSAFAVPGQAILGFLPSLQSLASLAIGAVYGWADIVTLQTPIGAPEYITVVPWISTFVVAFVATTLAVRWLPRHPASAWRRGVTLTGPVALYLAAILTGTDTPFLAGVRGISFAALALVWLAWRRSSTRVTSPEGARRLRSRRIAGIATLVAAAVVVGGGIAFVAAPANDDRFVLREEIDPPFDPLQYPSPLAGFREYSKIMREDLLMTVDGLEPGDRVRLATMDSFTGKLWTATGPDTQTDGSGSFALVGRELPTQRFVTPDRRENVTVTIAGYDDVWIPSVGYAHQLDFTDGRAAEASDDLRYNDATGTAVLTSGISEGDSYTIDAVVQRPLSDEALSDVPVAALTLPPITDNPDVTTSKALEYAGAATTPADQLRAIELAVSSTGFLSHGLASDTVPSRAGHGADRIDDLLSRTQMIGDEEQYASAFALMASTFGYPSRVVMGFAPEVAEGQPTEVYGADVSAWAEVAFDGVGWVMFDATPEETDIPQDQVPKPQIEPQPQVRQPPRAEKDPEDLLTPVELDNEKTEDDDPFVLPAWVIAVGLSLLIPAVIVLVPALVVGAVKARRARRRRAAAETHSQVAGAWDELVDRHAELGFAVPDRVTRTMLADRIDAQRPAESTLRISSLATRTDEAVFSGREVDPELSDRTWTEAMAAADAATLAVSRARRLLSRYRIRSRRRAGRSR